MPAASASWAGVEQLLRARRDLPHAECVGAVRDVAVEGHAHVDRDEVSVGDLVGAGDAVDDDLVLGDADRPRVPLVPFGRRDSAALADEDAGGGVELVRRDARRDQRADVGDRLGDEPAGRGDFLDLPRALANDHACAPTCSSAASIAPATSSTVRSPSTATSLPSSR